MDVRIENCFYSAEEVSQITAKAVQQMAKRGKMAKIARIVNDKKNPFPVDKSFISVTLDKFEALLLCNAMETILDHFGAPHGQPHHPFMTSSDFYPLSSVQ